MLWRVGQSVPLAVALMVGCFVLAIGHGEITEADAHQVYQVAKSMVEHGDFNSSLGHREGVRGRNGARYSKYGIGGSLLMVAPYALAKPFAAALPGHKQEIEQAAVWLLMPICAVLLVLTLYRLGLRMGAGEAAALLVAVGAVFGTFMFSYVQEFYTEPMSTLFIAASVLLAVERRASWAGAAFGMAMLIRPQFVVLAPALVLYLLIVHGRRAALLSLPPLAIALAIVLGYDYIRFGSLTDTGYRGKEGFTTPILKGTVGLLFRPSKSVLLFAPAILLVPAALIDGWRSRRELTVWLSVIFLVTFVMSATWFSWQGGWSWGPRLLLPALVPLLAMLAPWASGSRRRMRLLAAAFAAGLLVSISTVIVSTEAQQLHRPVPHPGPGIVSQIELVPGTISRTIAHAVGSSAGALGKHRLYANTWQVGVLRSVGLSGFTLAMLITLVLLAGAVYGAVSLRSALRMSSAAPDGHALAAQ
jgi:hypothetical protein